MSTSPENIRPEILSLARKALDLGKEAEAEDLYLALIAKLDAFYASNQKEMAAELQAVARIIESDLGAEPAIEFKQRTCETMLRMSMQARHRGRALPPRLPSAPINPASAGLTPFKEIACIYISSTSFDRDLAFYKDLFKIEPEWQLNSDEQRVAALRLASGPLFLLTDPPVAPGFVPLFLVDNLDSAVERLKDCQKVTREPAMPGSEGPVYVVSDLCHNKFCLQAKKLN